MNNSELQSILPDLHNMMKALDNGDFSNYEKKLSQATDKAIEALEDIIDDGTLKLDPEQTVRAVQVLTKSKVDIIEAKRKLVDTCIKGEVLIKSLDQEKGKEGKTPSVLLDYLERNGLDKKLDSTGTAPTTNSIFQDIANEGSDDELSV